MYDDHAKPLIGTGCALAAAFVLGVALSATPSALAQTVAADEPEAQAGQPPDAASQDSSEGSDETGDGEGVVLSPFDYEASESISEDASVSFPVDI